MGRLGTLSTGFRLPLRRNRGRCGARVADSQLCPSARRAWMNPLGLAGGLARRVPGAQLGGGRPGCGPSCTPEDPETPLVAPGGGVGASCTRSRGSVARVMHAEARIGPAGNGDRPPGQGSGVRDQGSGGAGDDERGGAGDDERGGADDDKRGGAGDDKRGGAGDDKRGGAGDDERGRAGLLGLRPAGPSSTYLLSDRPPATGIERGSARACTPGPTPPGRAGGLWPGPDSLRLSLRTTCRPGSRTAPRCPWSPRPR